jgi:hypothetical protein
MRQIFVDKAMWLIWGVLALLVAMAVLAVLLRERRRYAERGKAGAWWFVRLATLPIVAAAAVAVVLLARAVGGQEALAAFYLLAFTVGPLVYFGLHWLAGVLAGLARRDALAIGFSGLLMVLVPALLANLAQPWVFQLSRAIGGTGTAPGARLAPGAVRPLPHQVVEQRRFSVPEIGEVWTERWRAPAGVRVERIEFEVRGQHVEVDGANSNYLCRDGEDVHVFWHGGVAPARWRMHWRDANGERAYSDWTLSPPNGAAVAFAPEWLPDGVALPVRVPGSLVTYQWMRENGREDSRLALEPRPGAVASTDCVQAMRRPVTADQPQISGIGLRLWRRDTQQMLYVQFRRPPA